MAVLAHEDQSTGEVPRVGTPGRARRAAGESRHPPARAHVVAGRHRPPVPGCAPRRVARWPWLAAAAVATGLAVTGLGVFADGVSAAVPDRTATVQLEPGQTLADLARRYAPDSDPGLVVARIRELNRLGDAEAVPGLPLTVPVEASVAGRP
ncbi:MAG TPA: hypothetical protein VFG87_11310 [Amycolatopsis sp.]|nr:hypothetical protein [Amycolatopsis sp.]